MKISFYQTSIPEIQFIHTENHIFSYPSHTHTKSYTLGCIFQGELNLNHKLVTSNQSFLIESHTAHQLSAQVPTTLLICSIQNSFFKKHSIHERMKIFNLISNLPMLQNFMLNSEHFKTQLEKLFSQTYSVTIPQISENKIPFHRSFKKYWGITPHQFQIQKNIRIAQKLFKDPCRSFS